MSIIAIIDETYTSAVHASSFEMMLRYRLTAAMYGQGRVYVGFFAVEATYRGTIWT